MKTTKSIICLANAVAVLYCLHDMHIGNIIFSKLRGGVMVKMVVRW